jgi:hypothetical protein
MVTIRLSKLKRSPRVEDGDNMRIVRADATHIKHKSEHNKARTGYLLRPILVITILVYPINMFNVF